MFTPSATTMPGVPHHRGILPPDVSATISADDAAEIAALLDQLNADADEDQQAVESNDAIESLSVYGEITDLLVAQGVPRHEIAWIHDAKTASDREALFARMRKGAVRILIGSTLRMGVGVNVQERCYAVHHLTTPWRPCDVKQADGRIWRPGNIFPEVWIFRYIASPSFDGFSWQGIETKGKFEDAYLRGDPKVRKMGDVDEQIISAGEIKAIASGDPRIVQKVRLEHEIEKLEQQRRGFQALQRNTRGLLACQAKDAMNETQRIERLRAAIAQRTEHPYLTLFDVVYDLALEQARGQGKAIRDALMTWATNDVDKTELKRNRSVTADVGSYRGLTVRAVLEVDAQGKVKLPWLFLAPCEGADRLTNSTVFIGEQQKIAERLAAAATDLEREVEQREQELNRIQADVARIQATLATPWEHERTYRLMRLGLRYLNAVLNEDQEKTSEIITEVLALAESEGLDLDSIIKEGAALAEQGPDITKIQVEMPPLPANATPPPLRPQTEANAPTPAEANAPTPPQAAPRGERISLSIYADPLPIARPKLEVASIDLNEFATEAARKKAELAQRKRQQELEQGQMSFIA